MSKRSVSNSSKPPTGRRIPLASVPILEEEEHGKLLQFSDDEDEEEQEDTTLSNSTLLVNPAVSF